MATLRDLRYRDDQKITDESGHEVDLSQLDRNFSPMIDEKGEPITNYKLQAYIDNPKLADIEADLATVRAEPGQETPLYTPLSETHPDIFREGDPMERGRGTPEKQAQYRQRIDEASGRIDEYARAPEMEPLDTFKPTGSIGERQRFKQMIVEQKFDGVDPFTFDPMEQVDMLTQEDYQQAYEQQVALAGGQLPNWWSLTGEQRLAYIKNQKNVEYNKLKAAHEAQIAVYKDILGDYEKDVAIATKEKERRIKTTENAVKEYTAAREKFEKQRTTDLDNRIELFKKRRELQNEMRSIQHDPEKLKIAKAEMKAIDQAIAEIAQRLEQTKKAKAAKEAAKADSPVVKFSLKKGNRSRGKPDQKTLAQYWELSGLKRLQEQGVSRNDPRMVEGKRRAFQMMEQDGWDTDPMPEGESSAQGKPMAKTEQPTYTDFGA